MATFLLTWNPKKWNWQTLDDDLDTYRTEGLWVTSWSCGNRKSLTPGDRFFLLKQGPVKPVGIFASGFVASKPEAARHFTVRNKKANYIGIDGDVLLDPRKDVLPRSLLDRAPFSTVHWNTQSGGIRIPDNVAVRLEDIWDKHVRQLGLNPVPRPHDEKTEVTAYVEGIKRIVPVAIVERSAAARAACIAAKGVKCLCCECDFGQRYGEIGEGFIHVHHQTPLRGGRGKRETHPIEDLFPVCPNCHAMLHRTDPPMSIADLRKRMKL